MKEKTACFTGHRKIPLEDIGIISQRLKSILIQLINSNYIYFGVGGALGFDTIVENTILDLKKQYPQIKLILVLPCITQSIKWCEADKLAYEYIKKQADKIVYISDEYTPKCMYIRNMHLVDNSSICICYKTKEIGGTAFTVNYAKEKGLKIINIADELV